MNVTYKGQAEALRAIACAMPLLFFPLARRIPVPHQACSLHLHPRMICHGAELLAMTQHGLQAKNTLAVSSHLDWGLFVITAEL